MHQLVFQIIEHLRFSPQAVLQKFTDPNSSSTSIVE